MTQPFFLGREPSEAPLVPDLLASARALAEAGLGAATLSARFGPRFVVNVGGVPLEALRRSHFAEVADYDPHQDRLLVLGGDAPPARAGLHALVYRAKKEVGAIVDVDLDPAHAALARLPAAARGRTTLEGALAVLEKLRDADAVAFAGKTVVAVGRDVAEARQHLESALGGA